jgi:hypothetical protein
MSSERTLMDPSLPHRALPLRPASPRHRSRTSLGQDQRILHPERQLHRHHRYRVEIHGDHHSMARLRVRIHLLHVPGDCRPHTGGISLL